MLHAPGLGVGVSSCVVHPAGWKTEPTILSCIDNYVLCEGAKGVSKGRG